VGQKTNPIAMRLGIIRTWDSRWFARKKEYAGSLAEDIKVRKYIRQRLAQAGVSKIIIQRASNKMTINIATAKPGLVIGRRGAQVDQLRDELHHITGKEIYLNIDEIKKPDLDAQLVAQHIARQLEGRVSFRRAMKKAIQASMKSGALGVRVACSGRLGGSEMARFETYREGRVPLHTLRADIDYAIATAYTTFGTCGVKVWIFHGEVLENRPAELTESAGTERPRGGQGGRDDRLHGRDGGPGGRDGGREGGRGRGGRDNRDRDAAPAGGAR
jgi:small subunit ribosomal protein S3